MQREKRKKLVDIRDVQIDTDLPREKRMKSYLQQIKDPYNFKCNDIEVIVEFSENGYTLEECIKGLML